MNFANDAAVNPPSQVDSAREETQQVYYQKMIEWASVDSSTSSIGGGASSSEASSTGTSAAAASTGTAAAAAAAGVNSQTDRQDSYVYFPLRQNRSFSKDLFALAEIVEPDATFVAQDEETLALWAFILAVVRKSRDEEPVTRIEATSLATEIQAAFRVEWTRRDIMVHEMYGLVFRYEYPMVLGLMVTQQYLKSAINLNSGRGAILNQAQATNPNIQTHHRIRLNQYTGGKGCSPVRLFGFTFATLDNRDPSRPSSGSMFNTPDRESPLRAAIPETGRRIYLDGGAGNGEGCTPPENAVEIDLSQARAACDEAFASRLQQYQSLRDLIAPHGGLKFLKPRPRKRKKRMQKASHAPAEAIQPAYHHKFITHTINMTKGTIPDTDADPGAFRGKFKRDYHYAICKIVPGLGYVRYKIPRSGAARSTMGFMCRGCDTDDRTSKKPKCAMCIYVKDPSMIEKLTDAHGCDVVYASVSQFARAHKAECINKYQLNCKNPNENGYKTCFVHDGTRFKRLTNARTVDSEKQYGNSRTAGRTHSMSKKRKMGRKKSP